VRVRATAQLALAVAALALCLPAAAASQAHRQRFTAEELREHLRQVKELQVALNRLGADKRLAAAKPARAHPPKRGAKRPTPAAGGSGARPVPQDPLPAGPDPALLQARPSRLLAGPLANVKINDSSSDAFSATQSEETVAALGDLVLVAWNDGQGSSTGGAYQGYAWSDDGGQTWVDGGDPPRPAAYPDFRWMSDPVLTVNEKTGVFYYCAMANTDLSHNAIAVARGSFTDGAFAWQDVVVVREVSSNMAFLDKPWIVADSSGAGGSVYVTYSTFTIRDNQIDFQRSSDGGGTWASRQKLSSTADQGRVQASRPVVGPGGELYVLWFAIGNDIPQDFLRLRKSTDRGQSFGAEVTVTDQISNFGTGAPGFNRERGIHFPSLAVDRTAGAYRGRLYAAWSEPYNFQDDPLGTTGLSRLEVEPNGFVAHATPFTPGDVLRGTTSSVSPADLDYWAFDLNEGESIIVWADSLPAGQTYALRIFGGGADTAQSLCFGGDFTPGSFVQQAYYTFTAPLTSSYYLRMSPIDAASVTGGYRVRTGPGVRDSERGRDQRDAFVTWSDGGLAWSVPQRVNQDKIGLDNFLVEVGVGADGTPYVLWADYRDEPYGATAHRYLSRSNDGGASWQGNERVTDVATNWYYTRSNLAPNMGDYAAVGSGPRWLHLAWADGRDGTADVYGGRLDLAPAIASCAAPVSAAPGSALDLTWTVANGNVLFANDVTASLAGSRAWPLPAAQAATIGSGGTGDVGFTVQVPDTASPGDVELVFTATLAPGTLAASCATTITVTSPLAAGGGPNVLWLGPSVPNPARGQSLLAFSLSAASRAALRIYGLKGESVRTLVEGDLGPGLHQARWDGRDDAGRRAPAGTYFYRLETPGGAVTRRLVWLR
jgi:hypothetical protein